MILKNKECISEYFINENFYKNRKNGISAMMRVGDEEEFIKASILSVIDFFDEVVVVLNNPRDNTESIVNQIDNKKIKVYKYPFDLFPNGPGHDLYPEDSIKEISYYYNWCLSKTSYSHVCKWDGDMVATSNFSKINKDIIFSSDFCIFKGTNICGPFLSHISKTQPVATAEPRFFKVTDKTYYVQGKVCERLNFKKTKNTHVFRESLYLHYKMSKNIKSATKIWPDNWRESDYWINLFNRNKEGEEYIGEQPEQCFEQFVISSSKYLSIKNFNVAMSIFILIFNKFKQNKIIATIGGSDKYCMYIEKIIKFLNPMSKIITNKSKKISLLSNKDLSLEIIFRCNKEPSSLKQIKNKVLVL